MTPDEFNKIGAQVQNEIFEGYFNDVNQYLRQPQTEYDYANRAEFVDERISEFKKEAAAVHTSGGIFTLPTDLYRLGSVTYSGGTQEQEVQKVGRREFYNIKNSKLAAPSDTFPIFLQEDNSTDTNTKILVYPTTIIENVKVQYVKKPGNPTWAYIEDSNTGGYIYADTTTGSTVTPSTGKVNFDLHVSERHEVIKRILLYAGVIIQDPVVLQTMTSELAKDEQLDKS